MYEEILKKFAMKLKEVRHSISRLFFNHLIDYHTFKDIYDNLESLNEYLDYLKTYYEEVPKK